MQQKRTKKIACFRAPLAGALTAALSAALYLAASGSVAAQGADDPPVLFLDVSTGLIFEDRLNEDDLWESTTRFGVGYFSSTHNQRLSFETGVSARVRDNDAGLIDPFVLIDYAHFSRNTEIGADLSYRSSEVDGGNLAADFDTEDLADQTGRREDIGFGLRLVTGRASPFGTDTQLRFSQATFSDGATDDDTETHSAQSTLRFTIDPRIVLTLTGAWTQKETDDLVNTVDTTTRVTFGADLAIDRVWSASAALGYAEIETETTGGTTSVDGLEGSFILTRDLRNGSLVFSTDHVLTDDGWRNSVRVRRGFEMANGDAFDASLGTDLLRGRRQRPSGFAELQPHVRGGALSFGFDYSTDLDDTNMLVQRTRFDAALRQDLTDDSGWAVDGSIASVEYDNVATIDALRVEVGLAYLHGLSNDWNLAARFRHRVLYEDGDLNERSNILSLNLERRFSVRP
jgi:hypothetical protein